MSVAMAQRSIIDQLEFGDQNVRKQGDFVSLDMNIDISGIRLLTNDVLIVTPTLQSNTDKNRISRFSPIVITGSIRNKVVNRQIRLNAEPNYAKLNPVAIVKREQTNANFELSFANSFRSVDEGCVADYGYRNERMCRL